MKLLINILFFISFFTSIAQYTYVPDDNFEQALIDLGYDDVLDDYVITGNINSIVNLHISGCDISDLTGIEDFIALEYLNCSFNLLSMLDFSSNIELNELICNDNNLTNLFLDYSTNLEILLADNNLLTDLSVTENLLLKSLSYYNNDINSIDLSNNDLLEILNISYNNHTSINISSCTALKKVFIIENNLSGLDITNNLLLEELFCSNNSISILDLDNNTMLKKLNCSNNEISNLNLTNKPNLNFLSCSGNSISFLDISNNLDLRFLLCDNNQIIDLDVSNNTSLLLLYCNNNQLTSLDVRNTNNSNMIDIYPYDRAFDATNNPDLICIFVDNTSWSETNWLYIDSNSTFVATEQDCIDLGVLDYEKHVFSIYPNPVNKTIYFTNNDIIKTLSIFNVQGKLIKEFKNQESYNVNNLKNGIYYIKIKDENHTEYKKFIKN